jgi:hypothetical protein
MVAQSLQGLETLPVTPELQEAKTDSVRRVFCSSTIQWSDSMRNITLDTPGVRSRIVATETRAILAIPS